MYPYIVCYCGRELGSIFYYYEKELNSDGSNAKKIMDDCGIERTCCRSKILTFARFSDYYNIKDKKKSFQKSNIVPSHKL